MVTATARSGRFRTFGLGLLLITGLTVPLTQAGASEEEAPQAAPQSALSKVIPAPVSAEPAEGVTFELRPTSAISFDLRAPETREVADELAGTLRPSTGYPLPVVPAVPGIQPPGISLMLGDVDPKVGDEGYQLDATDQSVKIRAKRAEGLNNGVQSLRQLLPAKVEEKTAQAGPWTVPGGKILDYPRYPYRSAMLDVARHFWSVEEVEKYIDDVAKYKINYLHLHLTDDTGWRIAIDSWPNLTTIGGSTGVGGERPGFFTKDDYAHIVDYARKHFMTVVPEIEGPKHSNAARSSYAELNCDGIAPPLFEDITASPNGELCLSKEITYEFLDDVIREVAAMTPGPYLNIAGDEAFDVPAEDYKAYIARVEAIVAKYDKKLMGWQELAGATDPKGTTSQIWFPDDADQPAVIDAAKNGAKMIMSPVEHAYMDMKYDEFNPEYPVGHSWAGYTEVDDAYNWDPEKVIPGLPPEAITGVSATLFTELVFERKDIDILAFPRLPAIAEIGWSPESTHDWESFKNRLATHGPRWDITDVDFYRSPQIAWPPKVS